MFYVSVDKIRKVKAGFDNLQEKRKEELANAVVTGVQKIVPGYSRSSEDDSLEAGMRNMMRLMEAMLLEQNAQRARIDAIAERQNDLFKQQEESKQKIAGVVSKLENVERQCNLFNELKRITSDISDRNNSCISQLRTIDSKLSAAESRFEDEKRTFFATHDVAANTGLPLSQITYHGNNYCTFPGMLTCFGKGYIQNRDNYKLVSYNGDGTYNVKCLTGDMYGGGFYVLTHVWPHTAAKSKSWTI